jgi:hypothetical protein
MAAAASYETSVPDDIAELRILSDVAQLRKFLQPDGSVTPEVRADMLTNRFTAVQEMSIPSAVTITMQQVESQRDERGRSQRVITWLGKSAVDWAESGFHFYVSDAGARRCQIEVAEAHHNQETLKAGVAQIFISPQMSLFDAPVETAKAEHLHGQDAVRVSYPVTDKAGEIVSRRIESLLVSDVPLQAWVAMFKDPGNLFGKTCVMPEERSALSIMELFSQLSLPEELVPEGPVTILSAVLPYVTQVEKSNILIEQIWRFRTGQERYRQQAESIANRWLEFDIALAHSLERGTATLAVEGFIAKLQHEWGKADLHVIQAHHVGSEYIMTQKLAAVLEKAQQHILISQAAVATGNKDVLSQADIHTTRRLQADIEQLDMMQRNNFNPVEVAMHEALVMRLLARQNFSVGGGCAGSSVGSFNQGEGHVNGATNLNGSEQVDSAENATNWIWKKGVCRVKNCISPQPTEVGPCEVCRLCQHKFDHGDDPTLVNDSSDLPAQAERTNKEEFLLYMRRIIKPKLVEAHLV